MSSTISGLGATWLPEHPAAQPEHFDAPSVGCDPRNEDLVNRCLVVGSRVVFDPFSEPCVPMLPVWLTLPAKMSREEYADRLVDSIW